MELASALSPKNMPCCATYVEGALVNPSLSISRSISESLSMASAKCREPFIA